MTGEYPACVGARAPQMAQLPVLRAYLNRGAQSSSIITHPARMACTLNTWNAWMETKSFTTRLGLVDHAL